ncbi:Hypothetical protein, putative [Bodo saltans]|uniref:Uncharacterized protein n=1 Tax=Bodo saltans TaxID=75058 RepID=A0A0S4IR88_BODSA|nr:Hypothetical protein, putative [Bodo saltans]|eukprot:CUE73196.1 Hypothetical protein, putative [Bodo saltans]
MAGFVLPRPPQHREGRRYEQFSSRPVLACDVSVTVATDQRSPLTGLIDDNASQWFPASSCNRTTQDEFSSRTRIIQLQHESLAVIRGEYARGRAFHLESAVHNLHFDEQWEREAIERDSMGFLWSLSVSVSQRSLIQNIEQEERVGRAALDQQSIASFCTLVATAEFISRRHLVSTFLSQMWEVRRHENDCRQRAAIISASRKDYHVIVDFEQTCRRYLLCMSATVAAQLHVTTEESSLRSNWLASYWESRRYIVESFAEEGSHLLWRSEGLLPNVSLWQMLSSHAIVIQAVFRGWSVRQKARKFHHVLL